MGSPELPPTGGSQPRTRNSQKGPRMRATWLLLAPWPRNWSACSPFGFFQKEKHTSLLGSPIFCDTYPIRQPALSILRVSGVQKFGGKVSRSNGHLPWVFCSSLARCPNPSPKNQPKPKPAKKSTKANSRCKINTLRGMWLGLAAPPSDTGSLARPTGGAHHGDWKVCRAKDHGQFVVYPKPMPPLPKSLILLPVSPDMSGRASLSASLC